MAGPHHRRPRPTILPLLLLSLTASLYTSPLISAQGPTPIPVVGAVYATLEGVAFYVVGGLSGPVMASQTPSNQVVSLNLSIPQWNTSQPPWTILPTLPAPLVHSYQQGAIVNVNSKMELMISSAASRMMGRFDIKAQTWSTANVTLPESYFTFANGLYATADPNLGGKLVMPSGFRAPGAATTVPQSTLVYDPVTNTVVSAPGVEAAVGSGGVPPNLRYYSLDWCEERKSVLVYGGRDAGVETSVNMRLLEFSVASMTWSVVKTEGPSPGIRRNGCMVSAYKGTKMVVFGGWTGAETVGTIFILDVKTMTWTKGKDIDPSLARQNHACTVAGDSFMAWGGDGTSSSTFVEPVVYDLVNGRWTKTFALSNTLDSSLSDGPSGSSSSNVGAIAGGAAGALVLLLIAGFFIYRRRRSSSSSRPSKSRRQEKDAEEQQHLDSPLPSSPTYNNHYNDPSVPQGGHIHYGEDINKQEVQVEMAPMSPSYPPPPMTSQATPVAYYDDAQSYYAGVAQSPAMSYYDDTSSSYVAYAGNNTQATPSKSYYDDSNPSFAAAAVVVTSSSASPSMSSYDDSTTTKVPYTVPPPLASVTSYDDSSSCKVPYSPPPSAPRNPQMHNPMTSSKEGALLDLHKGTQNPQQVTESSLQRTLFQGNNHIHRVSMSPEELEQQVRLRQQELSRLEIAHEIQLKKLEIEALMAQR